MARSTYIYIMSKDGSPVSAFTVKKELLETLPGRYGDFLRYKIYRVRDGANSSYESELTDITDQIGFEGYGLEPLVPSKKKYKR